MARVLVVIKDDELANLIGLVLHRQGYQVHLANCAASSRERLAAARPDLMIVSQRQFETQRAAFDAARTIHDCPVLLVSDLPNTSTQALFRHDLVPYPFGTKELVSRVDGMLGSVQPSPFQVQPAAG